MIAPFSPLPSLPAGHPHTGILYQTDAAIYRPVSTITRYATNHTPYQLGTAAISTTASNSLQHLTHLPSSHSSPYQYLSQTTQHRQSAMPAAAAYGPILPSSVPVAATSPALTPGTTTSYLTGQQLHRPTTMNYNIGYTGTTSSTASFATQHIQSGMQHSPDAEPLTSQTVYSTPEQPGFASSQLSQHPAQQAQTQPQQQQQWNATGFQ